MNYCSPKVLLTALTIMRRVSGKVRQGSSVHFAAAAFETWRQALKRQN